METFIILFLLLFFVSLIFKGVRSGSRYNLDHDFTDYHHHHSSGFSGSGSADGGGGDGGGGGGE